MAGADLLALLVKLFVGLAPLLAAFVAGGDRARLSSTTKSLETSDAMLTAAARAPAGRAAVVAGLRDGTFF